MKKLKLIMIVLLGITCIFTGDLTVKGEEEKSTDWNYETIDELTIDEIDIDQGRKELDPNEGLGRMSRAGETPVYINNETELITLLNTQAVEEGNEYILTRDMNINASDLDKAICVPAVGYGTNPYYIGSFQSSFDGGGYTIKVNVDTAEPSRSLFPRLNGQHYFNGINDTRVPITFKDLTVHYTGDVEGTGFAIDAAGVSMDNIHVLVQDDSGNYHDIVPNKDPHGLGASIIGVRAAGFVDTVGALAGTQTTVNNISVTAGTIGTPKDTLESDAGTISTVVGFARSIQGGTSVENVEINVKNIYAISNNPNNVTNVVSGFADYIMVKPGNGLDYVRNITVNVEENIESYELSRSSYGLVYDGVFGFFSHGSSIENATLNVGGDVISRIGDEGGAGLTVDEGGNVHLIGANDWSSYAGDMTTPQYKDISVNVGGDVIAQGRGGSTVVLGVIAPVIKTYSTDNISVNISGDVVSKRSGLQLASGAGTSTSSIFLNYNINNTSNNDSYYIGGDVIIENDQDTNKGAAYFYGSYVMDAVNTTTGDISYPATIKNSSVEVGGDISVTSVNGSAKFYGLYYGRSMVTENNSLKFHGDITVTSAADDETSSAEAYGFSYIDGGNVTYGSGLLANISERTVKDNFVYIGGDISVTAEYKAMVGGFFGGLTTVGKATGNIVRIDGSMSAHAEDTDSIRNPSAIPAEQVTGSSVAGGFAVEVAGEANNNAVYVKDSAKASATLGDAAAGAFAVEIESDATVNANTVLGRAGKYDATDTLSYYETFANTVDPTATIEDNFYTSMLGGQRVTNELTYDSVNEEFTAVVGVQPLTVVSDTKDYTGSAIYLVDNNNGAITFAGKDAASTGLSTNDLTTASSVPAVASIVSVNGKDAVIDLPGIGYPYANNTISGNLFIDTNSNGIYDGSDTYVANETIVGKDNGTQRMSATTDTNGDYTMNVPLLSCFHDNEYTFSWDALDTSLYAWSSDSANDYASGTITATINYLDSVVYQGVVESAAALELKIVDDFGADDGIVVIYRTGATSESSILYPFGYKNYYDLNLELDGTTLTSSELSNVTWTVESAGGFSDSFTYATIADGSNKVTAKKSGVVKLTATYNTSTASIYVVVPGDVTRDGIINTVDAMRIQKYASSKTPNMNDLGINDEFTEFLADMNGDGRINTADKTVIQKMISKAVKPSN